MNIYGTLSELEMHGDYVQVFVGLANRGHNVKLFVQEPPKTGISYCSNLNIVHTKHPFSINKISPINLITLKIISLMRQQGSGVLYLTGTMLGEGLIAGTLNKTPILCDIRSPWSTQLGDLSTNISIRSQIGRRIRFFRWAIEERLVKNANEILVYSEELKNWMVNRIGVDYSLVTVIPPHIDTNRFRPDVDGASIRERYQIGSGPLLLYVGSMHYERGIDILVDALANVRNHFHGAKLMLVGPWPKTLSSYRYKLDEQITRLGLEETVLMTGLVPWNDIPKYLASADILLSAARYTDTYTMTPFQKLPEYLASGRPVILTGVGLAEYIIDENNALVVEPGRVDALSKAIIRLLENPVLAQRLSQEGRKLVSNEYDLERMIDLFESSLLSCLNN